MNKDEFLQMLQKKEIRKEILRIVKDGQNYIFNVLSDKEAIDVFNSEKKYIVSELNTSADLNKDGELSIRAKTSMLENENNQLKEKINEVQGKLRQAQNMCLDAKNHIQRVEGELQDSKRKSIKLSSELEEAQQRVQNLQMESEKWRKTYQDEKHNADFMKARLESKIEELKQEKQRLEQRKRSLEKANESLQSQMEERFSRGWELFEAYQSVDDHTKQILHNGVFTQETNFMSFICGGAQTSSLEKLWDALRECIMYGQQKDAQILWDIFEYCIELVNSSKTQAKYEVLPTKEGERFDSDIHTEGPNSLAQGKVVNVYLPGYQNTYNGKIIKKSIVQVG